MKLLRTKVLQVAILPLLCLAAASGDAPRSPLAVSAYAKEQQAVKKAEADAKRAKVEAHVRLIEDLKAAQRAQLAKKADSDSPAIAEELARIDWAIKVAQASPLTEAIGTVQKDVNVLELLKSKKMPGVRIKVETGGTSSQQDLSKDGKFKTASGDGGTWEWDGKQLHMHYANNRTDHFTMMSDLQFMYGVNADGVPEGAAIMTRVTVAVPVPQ